METVINHFISVDAQICHGRPRFKGTRIPLSTVLELLEGGMSIPEILDGYPSITEKSIRAAIGYARQRIEGEEFIPLAK